MLLFSEVIALLGRLDEELYAKLEYVHLGNFFAAVTRLAPLILLNAPRRTVGLPALTTAVRHSLAHILGLSLHDIDALWDVFGHTALELPSNDLFPQPHQLDKTLSTLSAVQPVGSRCDRFTTSSLLTQLAGAEILISPHKHCTTAGCTDHGKPLQSTHQPFASHLFTVSRGVLQVRVVTLYCKGASQSAPPLPCVDGGPGHSSSVQDDLSPQLFSHRGRFSPLSAPVQHRGCRSNRGRGALLLRLPLHVPSACSDGLRPVRFCLLRRCARSRMLTVLCVARPATQSLASTTLLSPATSSTHMGWIVIMSGARSTCMRSC